VARSRRLGSARAAAHGVVHVAPFGNRVRAVSFNSDVEAGATQLKALQGVRWAGLHAWVRQGATAGKKTTMANPGPLRRVGQETAYFASVKGPGVHYPERAASTKLDLPSDHDDKISNP